MLDRYTQTSYSHELKITTISVYSPVYKQINVNSVYKQSNLSTNHRFEETAYRNAFLMTDLLFRDHQNAADDFGDVRSCGG